MQLIDEQLEALRASFPGAEARRLGSGAYLITVPRIELPAGWSKPATAIRFLAPVGYPHAKPDCFWADAGLRRDGGAMPQAANDNQEIPETGERGLWFSWHVGQWSPNVHSLLTYMKVVQSRFSQSQ